MAGGYVNFAATDDQDQVRANYLDNYDRLVRVKRQYDPANVFRLNQNIRPGESEAAAPRDEVGVSAGG